MSIPPSYQSDLTTENEHRARCVSHPDRVALMADVDDYGRKVPVCHACWQERYPAIRERLRTMGLCRGDAS